MNPRERLNVSKLLKHPFIAGVSPFRFEIKDYSAEIRMKYEKEKAKQLALKNDHIVDNTKLPVPNIINKLSPDTTTPTTPSQIEVKKLSRVTTPHTELNDNKIDQSNTYLQNPSGEMIAVRAPRKIKRYINKQD